MNQLFVVALTILLSRNLFLGNVNNIMTQKQTENAKMTSKLPNATLNLKQFLLRQEVLKLYRDIFRTLRRVSDASTRKELTEWARTDFKNNKHHTDETVIKSMLHYGKKSLSDLEKSLAISK